MQNIIELRKLLVSMDTLVVFDGVIRDRKVSSFIELMDVLSDHQLDARKLLKTYHAFVKNISGEVWRNYVIECILQEIKTDLFVEQNQNITRELQLLQKIAELTPQNIIRLAVERFNQELSEEERELFADNLWPEQWPVWQCRSIQYNSDVEAKELSAERWLYNQRHNFIEEFSSEKDWADNYTRLVSYTKKVGHGIFSQYAAFKIPDHSKELEGLDKLDPIRISNLICQEREQSIVVHNTESFLNNYPANNIILYGNRGTGKSSLVKALLNEYVSKGLRLIQLKKNQVNMFPDLVKQLSLIPLKFIIFIDDLSFDDVEEDYKNLKSLLEGGVEARPENVLVYATSNRKHLVRESFADRRGDDVHAHDTVEEKLSLADRFGITVTFLSPDQETFLKIVQGLATQNDITLDKDELRKRALKWVVLHNGRSGRTARQFIDHLKGELGLRR